MKLNDILFIVMLVVIALSLVGSFFQTKKINDTIYEQVKKNDKTLAENNRLMMIICKSSIADCEGGH